MDCTNNCNTHQFLGIVYLAFKTVILKRILNSVIYMQQCVFITFSFSTTFSEYSCSTNQRNKAFMAKSSINIVFSDSNTTFTKKKKLTKCISPSRPVYDNEVVCQNSKYFFFGNVIKEFFRLIQTGY